jgi:hypothetical protein
MSVGRDSSVGIATRYVQDGPEFEFLGEGLDFPDPSRPALGPTQDPVNGHRVSFLRVKQSGHGVDHQPLSRAEDDETVELHFYSPTGNSLPVPW